jgi:type IV pilus assembly protein PilE
VQLGLHENQSRSEEMNKQRGVTLIELMIVVAIIGILAAVAYPSYQDSVRQSRRSDGASAATAVQLAQENFRGNCRFYAQSIGAGDTCGASAAASTVRAPAASSNGFYLITILANSATGNAYTIVATPQGAQAADTACSPMLLAVSPATPAGARTPAGCW